MVHDIRREAATRHLEAGAAWADTPRQVAEATDIVFTSLPGPTEVEAVALGEDGLLHGLTEGKVYFDLSTSSPALIRRIHEVFSARGIHALDAPVSGGSGGARTRTLPSGSGVTRKFTNVANPSWTPSVTRPIMWAPSAAAPSQSWSITARATSCNVPWRRCSPWG